MAETPVRIEELLVEREWLRSLARGLVADAGSADDLVQETWLTALTRPPRHRLGLRGWLATVLRNRAQDERIRSRRETRRAERSARPTESDDPAEVVARAELEQRVARLTLDLPSEQRDALLLRYHRGLSPTQIAERLGVPAGTVRSRLKRGLDRLRKRLDRDHDGDRRGWVVALLPLVRSAEIGGGPTMFAAPKLLAVAFVVLAVTIPTTALILARSGKETAAESLSADVPASAGDVPADDPSTDAATESPPVAPPGEPDPEGKPKKAPSILDRKIDLKLDGASLVEALEWIRAASGLAYELDPVLLRSEVQLNVTVSGISVRNALDLIAELGGLEWKETKGGGAYLRRKNAAPGRASAPPRPWFGGPHGLFRVPKGDAQAGRLAPEIVPPRADLARALPAGDSIEVRFAADGSCYLGERRVAREFDLWLALLERPDATVVVLADAKAPIARLASLCSRLPRREPWLVLGPAAGLPLGGLGRRPRFPPNVIYAPLLVQRGPLDVDAVYRGLGRLWQAAGGRKVLLGGTVDAGVSVGDYAVLVNEATRFGLPLGILVRSRPGPPGKAGLQLFPPKSLSSTAGTLPPRTEGVAVASPTSMLHSRPILFVEGREGRRNLQANGGRGTQAAVDRGLTWLASHQGENGSWNDDVEDTARAILAFVAVGQTPERGRHRARTAAGLAWIEKSDEPSGPATMALSEAWALTADPRWRRAAERAVSRTRSGLALRIARFCGVPVTRRRERVEGEDPRSCLLRILDGEVPSRSPTLGAAINGWLGPTKGAPDALLGASDDLLHDASLAALQAGGEAWMHWNRALKRAVVDTQIPEGENAGSWDPPEGGSRVRTTALRTATLTVYFRYRRLFEE